MAADTQKIILGEGRFLRLVSVDTWEYVERRKVADVVAVAAVTPERRLLMVEQYRPALGCSTIELPAGLVGDTDAFRGEALETAARRELLEEAGYEAEVMRAVTVGPSSSGLTSETITLFVAEGLRRVSDGGGDHSERITVHETPLDGIDGWLEAQAARGALIDPKVYTGLYFVGRASNQ